MAANSFIRFLKNKKPVTLGESMQKGHMYTDGWLEIGDWSWEITADTNFLKGTGASVGKAVPGAMSFSHSFDRSSPLILDHITMGTHFDVAQIDMLKQTGESQPQVYFQVMMGSVFITKVSSKGGEDGAIAQDVEMVFKEIQIGYKKQSSNIKSGKAGKLDPAVPFKWNISHMNFTVDDEIKLLIS